MALAKKIKIISLINSLGPAGAERVLLQLAQNIDKEKFEFSVCCLEKDVTLKKDFEEAGVEVVSLDIGRKYDPRALWRLYRFLKKGNFDILHTHLPYAGTLGRIAGRLAGVPKIASTEHNVLDSFKPLTGFLDRSTLFLADIVTCVAEEVERSFFGSPTNPFSKGLLLSGPKHLTIYNGIDFKEIEGILNRIDPAAKRKELGIGEGDPVVFNAARLIPWKGHADLIKSFSKVVAALPNAKLLIAGWGPLEEELRKQIIDLDLEGNIFLLGCRRDVKEILKIADVFSLPYNFKGRFNGGWMSIAIMEAMAASKPIVITAVPGVEIAVVDGKTGVVVPSGNTDKLAEAFLFLINDPKTSEMMGRDGHDLAKKNFNIEDKVRQYEAVYEKLYLTR
ncbi:MAG: glycosyltransferase [Candidatus Paceibacterota bacterium]|jgi:glycosyltransferase involved in cell wall biosynthesis